MRWVSSTLLVLGLSTFGTLAWADATSGAAAQALFEEGKKLSAAGNFAAACPKFAESQKLDPGAGTLLHLGNCYEKTGRTASAWATYIDAASAAKAQGRNDWAENAKTRAGALEPRLSRVTIVVKERVPGLEVRRDEVVLSEGAFGVALPVDPGERTFEATAPGKKKWRGSFTLKEGQKLEVAIPPLAADAAPVAGTSAGTSVRPPPADASGKEHGGGARTAGYVLAGVGAAGLVVGGVTGLLAMNKNSRSKELCPTAGACGNQEGVDANDAAKSMGTLSTISFIAGGALAATGVVLIVVGGPSAERSASGKAPFRGVTVAPSFGAGNLGASFSGAF